MSFASHAPDTSVTLLGRLSEFPPNQNAWKDFVAIYGFHLIQWCKRYGLQNADAEDVTQLTLLRLSRVMRSFDYNPDLSFRAWLRTVAHHVWQDFTKSKKNTILKNANGQQLLFTIEAERDFTLSLESAYEEEMLKKALDNVRLRVLPQTWEAFRLTTIDQIPSQEAADRIGVNLSSIYKAKSNVLKLLQEEMRHLEERFQ
ncbi:MAG: sigma-70 family RNA polymerase sigma factor [Gemmatales bacterium]